MGNRNEIERVYSFVHDLRPLKDTPRYSNNPLVKKKDVVASHSWRAETFPILLHDQFLEEGVDPFKVFELLNIHDWVEMGSKEIEALGYRNPDEKTRREQKVAEELLARFSKPDGERISNLLREFMAQDTIEAKVAKALENLESNMHVIEEVKPILNFEHWQRTIDYIKRRLGISRTVDALIKIQLSEIEWIVNENK